MQFYCRNKEYDKGNPRKQAPDIMPPAKKKICACPARKYKRIQKKCVCIENNPKRQSRQQMFGYVHLFNAAEDCIGNRAGFGLAAFQIETY